MSLAFSLLGLTIVVSSVIFWLVTKHEAIVMVAAGMSLIGLGTYMALDTERRDRG